MRHLTYLLLSITLLFAGCTKPPPPDPAIQDRLTISQALGGALQVQIAHPPVGPFKIVTPNSRYYRVRLRDDSIYYAEVYWSKWSIGVMTLAAIGGGDAKDIYRYRYWRETKVPLIGPIYRRVDE